MSLDSFAASQTALASAVCTVGEHVNPVGTGDLAQIDPRAVEGIGDDALKGAGDRRVTFTLTSRRTRQQARGSTSEQPGRFSEPC